MLGGARESGSCCECPLTTRVVGSCWLRKVGVQPAATAPRWRVPSDAPYGRVDRPCAGVYWHNPPTTLSVAVHDLGPCGLVARRKHHPSGPLPCSTKCRWNTSRCQTPTSSRRMSPASLGNTSEAWQRPAIINTKLESETLLVLFLNACIQGQTSINRVRPSCA
jgi:hypothetical protein